MEINLHYFAGLRFEQDVLTSIARLTSDASLYKSGAYNFEVVVHDVDALFDAIREYGSGPVNPSVFRLIIGGFGNAIEMMDSRKKSIFTDLMVGVAKKMWDFEERVEEMECKYDLRMQENPKMIVNVSIYGIQALFDDDYNGHACVVAKGGYVGGKSDTKDIEWF